MSNVINLLEAIRDYEIEKYETEKSLFAVLRRCRSPYDHRNGNGHDDAVLCLPRGTA